MCCDSMGDGVDFGRIVLCRIDIDTKDPQGRFLHEHVEIGYGVRDRSLHSLDGDMLAWSVAAMTSS